MKHKLLAVALFASAAFIGSADAGTRHNGGSASFIPSSRSRSSAVASFRSMPMRNFGPGRTMYSSQRFSSMGVRPPIYRSNTFNGAPTRQFARGNVGNSNRFTQFSNTGNRSAANFNRGTNRNGQVQNGNQRLRSDWRNHVVAQHWANWHRDWNRHHDHFFHGHRFVFIDGFWWGFDLGFWPWWWDYPYYGYGYGYGDGYGYGYGYPYDSGSYDQGAYGDQYSGQNGYGDQSDQSAVAAVQQRLAREGYYHGDVDGVLGPQTQNAIARYQRNHRLQVTGNLTPDTMAALGLRQVASY